MPPQPWLRRFFWLAGGLLVLGLLATLALPSLIKSQAESRGTSTPKRRLLLDFLGFGSDKEEGGWGGPRPGGPGGPPPGGFGPPPGA